MTDTHADRIVRRLDALPTPGTRIIVAIAGAPGSGKSTLAAQVVAAISARDGDGAAALLPMDGFHLDNAELDARGLRAVKGAPQTFDAAGFGALLRRVRTATDDLSYPLFDRVQDRTMPGAGHLAASTSVVVCEGNYLLLRAAPWADLAPLFDLTVMLSVPLPVLRARLVARWRDHGLAESAPADLTLAHDDTAGPPGTGTDP